MVYVKPSFEEKIDEIDEFALKNGMRANIVAEMETGRFESLKGIKSACDLFRLIIIYDECQNLLIGLATD